MNFSILDGHDIVYIARSSAPRFVSIGYQVGVRVPAHVVTPGRVILSSWTDARLERWLAEHEFASFTAHTVTTAQSFHQEVLTARANDYWVTVQQLDLGLSGVAVAVKDRKGECLGAIGMTVQSATLSSESKIWSLLGPLREAAQMLRAIL